MKYSIINRFLSNFNTILVVLIFALSFTDAFATTTSWGIQASPIAVSLLGSKIEEESLTNNKLNNWNSDLKYSPQIDFFWGMNFGQIAYEENFGFDIHIGANYIEHYLSYFESIDKEEEKFEAKKSFISMHSFAVNGNINFVYSFAHYDSGKFFIKIGPNFKAPIFSLFNIVLDEVSLSEGNEDEFDNTTPPILFGAKFVAGASMCQDLIILSFFTSYWLTDNQIQISNEMAKKINSQNSDKLKNSKSISLGDDLSFGASIAINFERLF